MSRNGEIPFSNLSVISYQRSFLGRYMELEANHEPQ